MILWLNCGLALTAGVMNLWAARRHLAMTRAAQAMRIIRGLMALAFGTIYGLDIVGVIGFADRVAWGQAVALFAWPVVWILPALVRMQDPPNVERIATEVRRILTELEAA